MIFCYGDNYINKLLVIKHIFFRKYLTLQMFYSDAVSFPPIRSMDDGLEWMSSQTWQVKMSINRFIKFPSNASARNNKRKTLLEGTGHCISLPKQIYYKIKKWKMAFTCCHPLLCISPALVVEHLPAKLIRQTIHVACGTKKTQTCLLSLALRSITPQKRTSYFQKKKNFLKLNIPWETIYTSTYIELSHIKPGLLHCYMHLSFCKFFFSLITRVQIGKGIKWNWKLDKDTSLGGVNALMRFIKDNICGLVEAF